MLFGVISIRQRRLRRTEPQGKLQAKANMGGG
jgi:hypothetical protein